MESSCVLLALRAACGNDKVLQCDNQQVNTHSYKETEWIYKTIKYYVAVVKTTVGFKQSAGQIKCLKCPFCC